MPANSRRCAEAAIPLILLLGIVVYANTFAAPFVFDDKPSLIDNTSIRSLDTFHHVPTNRVVGYLTFALNYQAGGLDVTGYHVVNLAIHLACALLIYALVRSTFLTPFYTEGVPGSRFQVRPLTPHPSLLTPHGFIPLFAALLFVAHPVQTQAVTYVVQRLTSLATMFYMLTLVLYVLARLRLEARGKRLEARGSLGPGTLDSGPWTRFSPILLLAGATVSAVLAMKTKEIAFTLPLAALMYEVFFFRGAWKRRFLYLLPLLATLPIVPLGLFSTGSPDGDILADIGERTRVQSTIPRLDYLFTQFRVIVTYLRLLVLPVNQNLDYDYPLYTSFFTPMVILSFLLMAAFFALALWLFHNSKFKIQNSKFRLISFGILWFFLTLAVESSIIPIEDVIFEHRLYLPGFGAATAFAAGFLWVGEAISLKFGWRWVAAAALVVAALGTAAWQRNQVWRDPIRLWQDVVAKSPYKARGYNNLGVAMIDAGRQREAIGILSRAIEIDPLYYHAYNNLGHCYIMTGQSSTALPVLNRAIQMAPEFVDPYINLALAMNQLRQFRATAVFVQENLGLIGDRVEAHYHLGVAYAFLGEREAARRQMEIVSRAGAADLVEDLTRLLR